VRAARKRDRQIWAGAGRIGSDGLIAAGVLLHWNGSAWLTSIDSPHQSRIDDIWGSNANDVWATTIDGIVHRSVP